MAVPEKMKEVIFYSPAFSNRLNYICEWAGELLTGRSFRICSDRNEFISSDAIRINYSPDPIVNDEIHIIPAGLLSETGIRPQSVNITNNSGLPFFFQNESDTGFDIFAASFFLLSRYEEYLPHETDQYGRYAHHQSTAFRDNFLDRPLINEWFANLAALIRKRFPAYIGIQSRFLLLPTYDIDIAWMNLHQPVLTRAKNKLKGWIQKNEAPADEQETPGLDPYDSYSWLNRLHKEFDLKPYYFFLLAAQQSEYDKNIDPSIKAMRDLVYQHYLQHPVGIHPSWQSGDNHRLLTEEIGTLAAITGNKVTASRQHYLRLTIPDTYERLIEAGIRYDFSMGYGRVQGFRASVCTPFRWYNLRIESATDLHIIPFCFMEVTSIYHLQQQPAEALQEMKLLYDKVKAVNGTFSMIWHNHMLGSFSESAPWKKIYRQFYLDIST